MNDKIMAVCDLEEPYLYRLAEFLQSKTMLPYTLYCFTDIAEYKNFTEDKRPDLILVAEGLYRDNKDIFSADEIFILNESGKKTEEEIVNINKYQSSENIFREIMKSTEGMERQLRKGGTENEMRIIGNYSPIRRCLQTTFTLCMGQLLAGKHKILYMNFESFSGFGHLLQREFAADISDILYYFKCEKEKLSYRLAGMVQSMNGLDYIPPLLSSLEMDSISGEQWIELFREIERVSDYEFLILDLSENMQGLFDILRECIKVYTITREDDFAAAKVRQYEELLEKMDYKDIIEKTRMCSLPLFRKLPYGLEQLTHGDLAGYVKSIIEEDIYGKRE